MDDIAEKQKDKAKETTASFAIIIWVTYGAYALITDKLNGIIALIIYFAIGIFVASFAAIIPYLLQQALVKLFVKLKVSDSIAVFTGLIMIPIQIIWIILVAKYFLSFINNI